MEALLANDQIYECFALRDDLVATHAKEKEKLHPRLQAILCRAYVSIGDLPMALDTYANAVGRGKNSLAPALLDLMLKERNFAEFDKVFANLARSQAVPIMTFYNLVKSVVQARAYTKLHLILTEMQKRGLHLRQFSISHVEEALHGLQQENEAEYEKLKKAFDACERRGFSPIKA